MDKLWEIVNKIDTFEKVEIAKVAINESEVSNEEYDDLMMAVSQQYRFLREIEKDKCLKPQYRQFG